MPVMLPWAEPDCEVFLGQESNLASLNSDQFEVFEHGVVLVTPWKFALGTLLKLSLFTPGGEREVDGIVADCEVCCCDMSRFRVTVAFLDGLPPGTCCCPNSGDNSLSVALAS